MAGSIYRLKAIIKVKVTTQGQGQVTNGHIIDMLFLLFAYVVTHYYGLVLIKEQIGTTSMAKICFFRGNFFFGLKCRHRPTTFQNP